MKRDAEADWVVVKKRKKRKDSIGCTGKWKECEVKKDAEADWVVAARD